MTLAEDMTMIKPDYSTWSNRELAREMTATQRMMTKLENEMEKVSIFESRYSGVAYKLNHLEDKRSLLESQFESSGGAL